MERDTSLLTSTQTFTCMDQVDAERAAMNFLLAKKTEIGIRAKEFAQTPMDRSPVTPKIMFRALFDTNDKMVAVYILTRDIMNYTQATLVEVESAEKVDDDIRAFHEVCDRHFIEPGTFRDRLRRLSEQIDCKAG